MRPATLLGDRGAATIAALSLASLIMLAVCVVGQLAAAAELRQSVRAAADLSALAAANAILGLHPEPCEQARGIAASNGADLLDCSVTYPVDGARVSVEVRARERAWPLTAAVAPAVAALRPMGESPGHAPAPP